MQAHILKTDPKFFSALSSGDKKFEIRKNDRGFEVGDILILAEHCRNVTCPDRSYYTGAVICAEVTYKTDFEQKDEMVVLGVKVKTKFNPNKKCEELPFSITTA